MSQADGFDWDTEEELDVPRLKALLAAPLTVHAKRKTQPVASGVLAYFPDAVKYVAYVSKVGNDQHNPGQPMHWAREKSTDHEDCAGRHLTDHMSGDPMDTDGVLHLGKLAWRALAALQIYLETHDTE